MKRSSVQPKRRRDRKSGTSPYAKKQKTPFSYTSDKFGSYEQGVSVLSFSSINEKIDAETLLNWQRVEEA